jgi:hypothetical protein
VSRATVAAGARGGQEAPMRLTPARLALLVTIAMAGVVLIRACQA